MVIKMKRDSNIELLKVISMFLIVISHVTQTLGNTGMIQVFDFDSATNSIQNFILILFRHLGALGNVIFVICSSWFLVDTKKDYKKKIFHFIFDTLLISLGSMFFFILLGKDLSREEIWMSVFPITYVHYWFITGYLLFLFILPFLNKVLKLTNQKELLRLNLVLLFLYYGINFIKPSYFYSDLFPFIIIFFMIAYIKLYLQDFSNDRKKNGILFALSVIGLFLLILGTNLVGLKTHYFPNKMSYWVRNYNPFLLLIALSLFNLFKSFKIHHFMINYFSSLSLYVYLIHENLLVRNHIRVSLWNYVYHTFSFRYIVVEVLIYSFLFLLISLILSILYKYTVSKIITIVVDKISQNSFIMKKWGIFEEKILKMK